MSRSILQRRDRKVSRSGSTAGEGPWRVVGGLVVLLLVAALGAAALLPVQRAAPPVTPEPVEDQSPFQIRLRQGLDAARRGGFAEASQRFKRALQLDPVSVEAWNNLGVVLVRQGDLAGGVKAFREALELEPAHADAHRNLAVALERQRDSAGATQHYRSFLSLSENSHPERAEIRRHLTVVTKRRGQWTGTASRWLAIPERARGRYAREIVAAATRYGVDPKLVRSVIRVESGFNPRAVSRKGARGLMQLMPGTASAFGVRNAFSPGQNIDGGVRYLRHLIDRYRGNLALALAAYNAGPTAVDAYRGIPPYRETRKYVRRVLALYAK